MSQQPTFDPTEDAETAPLSPPPTNNTSTAHQSIAATATTNPKRRQPRRPRAPSPSTLARASLIDQIMRESNHTPHYTPPTTGTSSANPTSTAPEEELDPDAAAAAAFKADFLAQAEARNLSRRKPKAAATTTSGGAAAAGAAVSSGPKLGGSRTTSFLAVELSQRTQTTRSPASARLSKRPVAKLSCAQSSLPRPPSSVGPYSK